MTAGEANLPQKGPEIQVNQPKPVEPPKPAVTTEAKQMADTIQKDKTDPDKALAELAGVKKVEDTTSTSDPRAEYKQLLQERQAKREGYRQQAREAYKKSMGYYPQEDVLERKADEIAAEETRKENNARVKEYEEQGMSQEQGRQQVLADRQSEQSRFLQLGKQAREIELAEQAERARAIRNGEIPPGSMGAPIMPRAEQAASSSMSEDMVRKVAEAKARYQAESEAAVAGFNKLQEALNKLTEDPSVSESDRQALTVVSAITRTLKQDLGELKAKLATRGGDIRAISEEGIKQQLYELGNQKYPPSTDGKASWNASRLGYTIDLDFLPAGLDDQLHPTGEFTNLSDATAMKLLQETGFLNPSESLDDRMVRVNPENATPEKNMGSAKGFNVRENGMEFTFDAAPRPDGVKRSFAKVVSPSIPGVVLEIQRNYSQPGDKFKLDLNKMPLKPLLAQSS